MNKIYRSCIKRFIDFILALSGLLILSPLLLFIALLLFISNSGKPFFTQLRPGKNGKIFKIYKFRTMVDKKNGKNELLPDVDRLTRIGKFIRKTSLDEIPQLFNVLKGNMSLVGPRPLLIEYLPLYNEKQARRHEVLPGITGWAQVNGRNAISWNQKFDYDIWYVDHICFNVDMRILWMTFLKIFNTEEVNYSSTIIMEKFQGNQDGHI